MESVAQSGTDPLIRDLSDESKPFGQVAPLVKMRKKMAALKNECEQAILDNAFSTADKSIRELGVERRRAKEARKEAEYAYKAEWITLDKEMKETHATLSKSLNDAKERYYLQTRNTLVAALNEKRPELEKIQSSLESFKKADSELKPCNFYAQELIEVAELAAQLATLKKECDRALTERDFGKIMEVEAYSQQLVVELMRHRCDFDLPSSKIGLDVSALCKSLSLSEAIKTGLTPMSVECYQWAYDNLETQFKNKNDSNKEINVAFDFFVFSYGLLGFTESQKKYNKFNALCNRFHYRSTR